MNLEKPFAKLQEMFHGLGWSIVKLHNQSYPTKAIAFQAALESIKEAAASEKAKQKKREKRNKKGPFPTRPNSHPCFVGKVRYNSSN